MKDDSIKFFNKIEATKSLLTLPHILLKLLEVCNKKPVKIDEISQIINKDASLSARLMSMANPVCYGPPNRVKSIDQALLFLGPDTIKNIAISSIVQQSFNQIKNSYISSLKILWKHSLMSAVLAKMIAEKVSYPNHDEAYLAGLFHDIGKLVLWVNFTEEYTKALQATRSNPALLLDSEKRIGASHNEIGAWLINSWALQSFIADAVLYHHEPKYRIVDALPLVKIVYVANILSSGIDRDRSDAFGIAKEVLGLEHSVLDTIVSLSDKKVRQTAQSLDINIENLHNFDESACEKDAEKQKELVHAAINISQLQGTLQNLLECHDADSMLKVVRQGLQILFDLKSVLFFLYNHEKDALQGNVGNEEGYNLLIKEIVIPVQGKSCLLTKTLAEKTSMDSFGHIKEINLTIIDSQIIRLSGKEGMFCIPMLSQEKCVGVMVIGIDEAQSHILFKDLSFINMFANQVAVVIDAENERKSLIQSEHLTAHSAVADKVAHEVSNSLSIMKNYLKILGLKLAKDSPAQEEIMIINEEIDRINLIIGELSNFLEPKEIQKELVDINTLISDLIKITHESLLVQSGVTAKFSLESSIPPIMTDKNGLKQVVINLIKNAVEAMPDGGDVEINTRLIAKSQNNGFNKKADKKEQEFVEIIISDSGSGIPEEIKSNLFEPFVSSKGGGHSGLGLSIAHSIIKGLKGTISCESDEATGTTFKILLPINNR